MMTEKQAWEYMADAWENATKEMNNNCYSVRLEGSSGRYTGLCACIACLESLGKITMQVKNEMWSKINCALDQANKYTYLFPTNTELGAKGRAEFCKQMAVKYIERK